MMRLLHGLVRVLPVLLMVIAWEAAVRLGVVAAVLLPAPSDIAAAWWRLAADGDLLPHAAASLWRAAAGLAISVAAGVVLGLAMALSRTAERLVQPLITFLYPLPKSALIPIVLVWFGFGHGAQIAVIVLGCLLPVVLGAYNGARGVEPALVWSARSLGARRAEIVRDVVVRAALPDILAGIRVALALGFVLLVSAEMVGARRGLGFLIAFLGEAGAYPAMFAVVVTVMALGFTADRMLLAATRRLLRWREA